MDKLTTACGRTIIINAETRSHLQAHGAILPLLEEVASLITLPSNDNFYRQELCLHRIIGQNGCVATRKITASTPSIFALRTGRHLPSRVAVGFKPVDCDTVSVLAACRQGQWHLITAYIGNLAPREPHDPYFRNHPEALPEALDFWCSHALVYEADWSNLFVSNWEMIMKDS